MSDIDPQLVAATWQTASPPPEAIPTSADVVIIGGGIVGVSTAWFLAQQGCNVVLCEKANIACEQSGRNWGWVRVQGRDPREIPMMLESLAIWSGLEEATGEDVGFRRGGCTFTANKRADLDGFAAWSEMAADYGIDSRVLNQRELASLLPDAAVHWHGALYTASDGRAEPHLATPAIARAAARAGATLLTRCAVRGIESAAGSVAAVVTEHGSIRTSTVLCAAGAWSSMFCRSLGVDVPQLRVRGTVARTAPAPELMNGNLFDDRIGIRRRQDGGYTVAHGSVLEHPVTPASFRYFGKFFNALRHEYRIVKLRFGRDFIDEWRTPARWDLDMPSPFERQRILDPEPNSGVLRDIQSNMAAVFPTLQGVPLIETWGGMIEASPDIVPVIDRAEGLPGLYIATGFSGHGFGIGPGAGKAIAAMLTNADGNIDLQAFRLQRFFDGSPIQPTSGI